MMANTGLSRNQNAQNNPNKYPAQPTPNNFAAPNPAYNRGGPDYRAVPNPPHEHGPFNLAPAQFRNMQPFGVPRPGGMPALSTVDYGANGMNSRVNDSYPNGFDYYAYASQAPAYNNTVSQAPCSCAECTAASAPRSGIQEVTNKRSADE